MYSYRCGDNLHLQYGHKFGYGIVPFKSFSALLQNHTFDNIYILTEGKHRSSPQCASIISDFFDYMRGVFPTTTIIVKRGDDILSDMTRLSKAKVTICSASTFCLFPAIANPNTAYYPISRLVPTVNVSRNFHFFSGPVITHGGGKFSRRCDFAGGVFLSVGVFVGVYVCVSFLRSPQTLASNHV
jgi:hypothetical protein